MLISFAIFDPGKSTSLSFALGCRLGLQLRGFLHLRPHLRSLRRLWGGGGSPPETGQSSWSIRRGVQEGVSFLGVYGGSVLVV